MKFLFKLLLKIIIVLLVLGLLFVVLPLALLYKKTTAPVDQYVEASETSFYTELDGELSALITDSNEDSVVFTITEAYINRVIQKALSKENSKYLVSTYEGEIEHDYMMVFGGLAGLKGVWTTLSDDQLKVTAGADFVLGGTVLYQTGFEIVFNIVLAENNEYFLKVAKIQMGSLKLPLKQAYQLTNFIVKTLTSQSLNDMVDEHLDFGDFNLEDYSFTVGETELTDYLYDIDPTFAALLKIIYKEELLVLDVSDQGFDISLNLGAFRRLPTDLNAPSFTKWESEADKAAFMAGLATQATTSVILNPTDPRMDLTEADVNAILDYTLGDKVQFDFPIKFKLNGNDVEYKFSSTNLFVRMQADVLSIHLKMTLTKTGMAGAFDMQFNLTGNISMNSNGDMVLTIINANIGSVVLDQETLTGLISVFDANLMVGNTLVIPKEKINEMFQGSGLVINNSVVVNGKLRLHFGLDN
ncbi:hypothetical protein N7603_06595 [Acholeplasma vituli]|uniref:Uncharacterized protein n=1 Tax=Paracholeplasma vituli TaxID=69473 RepID=A0ABT2PWJ0_9MOLU|nr:hypothetical protein [Paracholeplasma vituli]MCU0105324.1 hypothetical protein [Paracholeplasma vituli]